MQSLPAHGLLLHVHWHRYTVRAFFDMANAGTNVDVSLLSSGIYEALVTTVGGLVVGIIALFAYDYLVSQVDNVVNKMEARTMEFMDLLNEPAN